MIAGIVGLGEMGSGCQGLADRDFSILYYVLANAAGERLEIPMAK